MTMAKRAALYWLGEGVKTIDGQDYGEGVPLPVNKITDDDLKKMIKDGRIGEKIGKVESAGDKALTVLQDKIKSLESEVSDLKSKDRDKCEEFASKLAASDEKIEQLEADLAEATKPDDTGAGAK
jgi:vacuolar-type H+-ATPase subunit I/STV1